MAGSGLEDLWETVYAKNSVVHMMRVGGHPSSLPHAEFAGHPSTGIVDCTRQYQERRGSLFCVFVRQHDDIGGSAAFERLAGHRQPS